MFRIYFHFHNRIAVFFLAAYARMLGKNGDAPSGEEQSPRGGEDVGKRWGRRER